MANRRMFSLDVVDTDLFMNMPMTAQNLYFHFGMRADDDGFVSSPKTLMRMLGANEDDLRILISKGLMLPFDSGIVVIVDWNINNQLRKDRYKETIYVVEKSQLKMENGRYYIKNKQIENAWQPYGNHMATQYSLGEDSIDKDNKDIMSEVSEDTIEQPVKEEEKYNKESFERKIVDKLIDHVVKLNPRQKEKPKTTKQLNAWCDEVEKMIRIDKFSEKEVEMMLDFAITDSFWHKNILSTAKLRKQTDKLMIAIKAKNKGGMEKKLENNGRMDEPEITPEQREAVRQLMLSEGELW